MTSGQQENQKENAAILPAEFTARPAVMDDAQAVTDLLNADAMAVSGEEQFSLEECHQEWATPGFDLATSSMGVFAPSGQIAGYIEVYDLDKVPEVLEVFGAVHPDYLGNGIGRYLLRWAEKRLEVALDRAPVGQKVTMLTGNPGDYTPAKRLLEKEGYRVVRVFLTMAIAMQDTVPEPQWPAEVEVKNFAEFDDARAIFDAHSHTFDDHWALGPEKTESGYQKFLHRTQDPDFDPTLWFVALINGEVAAYSLCMPKSEENPEIGHVSLLGVVANHRRKGLAQAILYHSFREFQARGTFSRVRLSVDASSPTGADRLYRKVGMSVESKTYAYEKVLGVGRSCAGR